MSIAIPYKKRIIGFLLLIGIALILAPLLFGRSLSDDELKLSAHIPAPPPKPQAINVPIPPQEATMPAVTAVTKMPAGVPAAPNSASSVAFETLQSTDNEPNDNKSNNNKSNENKPATTVNQAATPQGNQQASQPTVAGVTTPVSPAATTIQTTLTASAPVVTAAPVMAATPTTAVARSVNQPVSTKTAKTATSVAAPKPANSASSVKATSKNTLNAPNSAAWAIQVGSFSDKINAKTLMKTLQAHGFATYMHSTQTTTGEFIRVLIGPELRRNDAEQTVVRLKKELNIQGIIVKAIGS